RDIIMDMNGNAVELAPHAYFATQISNFGVGVFGYSDVAATAVVSQAHNKLIFKDSNYGGYAEVLSDGSISASNLAAYQGSSVEYAVNNGLTYLNIRAIGIAEVPVAYGHKFDIPGGALMVGGALKYIKAFTYMENVKIDDSDDDTDDKNDNTDSSFGVDLGLAYEPSYVKDLTLAIVAKNLNKPEFSFVDGSNIELKPMVRAGVAYNIFESLEIAADIDLTKNETFISAVKSQMVGGGVSYHPSSWFAIRGGLMTNLDSSDKADMIYTAGFGIGLKWFQVDLSAQMSANTTTVDGTDYPQYAKVNLALISRW
ncbi:MAG: conjugal transfer protein TraF, partial [Sulfurimonas sp.]|nr:conjugal transfer protein TraF [Sulfurimonas sp.]